jgi:ADP-ribose pyrophosphatase
LETVRVRAAGNAELETYHAIRQADYVQTFCMHESGQFVLVRQFRPILEMMTLELPGGLRDGDDAPELSACREVEEETGLEVAELVPLADTFADAGRLTNRLFGYFALVRGALRQNEAEVEPLLVSAAELRRLAATGALAIPSHIGLLYLAAINPHVQAICAGLGFAKPPWIAD